MSEPNPGAAPLRQAVFHNIQLTLTTMGENSMNIADIQAMSNVMQVATAQALLYVGDQIGEQVKQQKLANVIASIDRTTGTDVALLGWDTEQNAAAYVRARIGEIVTPESETKQ